MVSEGGGQGLQTLACLQDLSQARARWGAESEQLLTNFGVKVVLPGIEHVRTLQDLSTLAGQHQVQMLSYSTPPNQPPHIIAGGGVLTVFENLTRMTRRPEPSTTVSSQWRPRLAPADIARGTPGTALVFDKGKEVESVQLTPWHSNEPWRSAVLGNWGRSVGGPRGTVGELRRSADPPSPGLGR
jgi:hypothetical protein